MLSVSMTAQMIPAQDKGDKKKPYRPFQTTTLNSDFASSGST
jgi:DNA topoisomerase IA